MSEDFAKIARKKTRVISVGNVKIGGDNPIIVQTMTNTKTTDITGTLEQMRKCVDAGAELIRVSVPDKESTEALVEIVKNSPVPIIADVHFHYKRGIEAVIAGAKCIRINPGNVGSPDRAREIVKAVKDYGASIRIGVNAGSLEERLLEKYKSPCPEALVESAMDSVKILEDLDFFETKISVKASNVILAVKSYELLSQKCDYPLHLGITEAGTRSIGTVRSSIGLGCLLMQGIGDTMRVSLSIEPQEEILVAYDILKSLGIRARGVNIISCPSCARQNFDVCKTIDKIEKATAHIVKPISVSVLGCVVNGLGEAKHTNIGVTGAGSGQHLVYIDGKTDHKIPIGEDVAEHVIKLIEDYSQKH